MLTRGHNRGDVSLLTRPTFADAGAPWLLQHTWRTAHVGVVRSLFWDEGVSALSASLQNSNADATARRAASSSLGAKTRSSTSGLRPRSNPRRAPRARPSARKTRTQWTWTKTATRPRAKSGAREGRACIRYTTVSVAVSKKFQSDPKVLYVHLCPAVL